MAVYDTVNRSLFTGVPNPTQPEHQLLHLLLVVMEDLDASPPAFDASRPVAALRAKLETYRSSAPSGVKLVNQLLGSRE